MHIRDLFNGCQDEGKIPFSFEFFPPKTDKGWDNLYQTVTSLLPLNPAYVSVTYGAGGSTRDNTHRLVTRLHQTGLTVVSHLTCEGSSREEIDRILQEYDEEGMHNILALKGDVPKDQFSQLPAFGHAIDLVRHIRTTRPSFGIGVAGFPEGHPTALNRLVEIDLLKAKVDAGADYIVTQLFFDNRDFYDFRERCELAGIRVPIIAGIMPVSTRAGMIRMADLAARCRFPAKLLKAVERTQNDESLAKVGIHYATEQISDLLHQGVAGIHLYTLNNSSASIEICRNLGLDSLSVKEH